MLLPVGVAGGTHLVILCPNLSCDLGGCVWLFFALAGAARLLLLGPAATLTYLQSLSTAHSLGPPRAISLRTASLVPKIERGFFLLIMGINLDNFKSESRNN